MLSSRSPFVPNFNKNWEYEWFLTSNPNATLENVRNSHIQPWECEIEFLSIMRAMQEEVEKYYQEVLFESSWLKPLNKNATLAQLYAVVK